MINGNKHKNKSINFYFADIFKLGDIVKYKNTGTIGTITDIKETNKVLWVLLDSTNLYYDINFLEKVDDMSQIKKIHLKNIEDDIEEKIRLKEEISSSYSPENIDGTGGAG